MKFNNEEVGIGAEIAIADAFQLSVNPEYYARGNRAVCVLVRPYVQKIFSEHSLPRPLALVAEGKNPIDFKLEQNATLSVKTNQQKLGKVAPQTIGQPTSTTYFDYFSQYFSGFDKHRQVPYEEKVRVFKEFSMRAIDQIMPHYWSHLFECDYLLYFYDFLNKEKKLKSTFSTLVLERPLYPPRFEKEQFSFSQSSTSWNESNTVKYRDCFGDEWTLGEFQAHANRDCFKFRFDITTVQHLLQTRSLVPYG